MPPKMIERVDALEVKMAALKNSLTQTMDEFHHALMTEFSKLRDYHGNDEHQSPLLSEESVSKYKMAAKKVKVPPFDGEDPAGWITHAETYFEVHGSSEEVKVRLAKLNM